MQHPVLETISIRFGRWDLHGVVCETECALKQHVLDTGRTWDVMAEQAAWIAWKGEDIADVCWEVAPT